MSRVAYNFLGSSGLRVSNICLGTMLFGEHPHGRPGCSETEAHTILDRYAALGGNFLDTADMYQFGKSEEIIGSWLAKQPREKFVVATKCRRKMDTDDVNGLGASRKHIMWSVQQSLRRLQTDYIDLFYIHMWDPATPLEETLSTLNDLVRKGQIRYLGMSNMTGWQLQKIIDLSKYRGWEPISCVQNQYSLLVRSCELEVFDVCKNEGVSFLPWSPLKGGWLSGRVGRQGAPEGSRVAWAGAAPGRSHHSHPSWEWFSEDQRAWLVIEALQRIADKYGKSVPQVALRWALQKPIVPSLVVGARTLDHLEDNIGAGVGWTLTQEEMAELDEVSQPTAPYPYDYQAMAGDFQSRLRP